MSSQAANAAPRNGPSQYTVIMSVHLKEVECQTRVEDRAAMGFMNAPVVCSRRKIITHVTRAETKLLVKPVLMMSLGRYMTKDILSSSRKPSTTLTFRNGLL